MPGNVKCATPARPNPLWIAVALAAVTLAVYCPVTGFQFVNFDDPAFIAGNPHVQGGLTAEDFKWAWRSEVTGDWHPITMLSLMLDCQLFGVKPWWPHLVNMVLHAANAVLLFGLLRRMTGALWRSAVVAALFALHPLHVESVAWVSERKDVLSTLFWFLTTWAYLRYAEECKVRNAKCRIFYGLSLVYFALGLMSKPMLVTLPFTLLLLDYWPLKRRAVAEKIPFFAMSAALCVVTIWVQKHGGGMLSLQHLPPGQRVCNALISYARYVGMMFWPRQLAGLYLIKADPWPWWEAALAALLLLGVSALALAQWRRRPYLAVGWFWYLGTLVPVIGLVQSGMQAMADRFTYVPLIGLFVMLVWGGWDLAGAGRTGRFAPSVTAAALAVCAALTAHQEFYWKDSEALFKRMVEVEPDNYRARLDLGDYYAEANRVEEAISNLTAAIHAAPEEGEAHNNLASVLLGQKRYDEAIEHLRTAARLHPGYFCFFNLANGLTAAAIARQDTNAFAEAVRTYEQALRLQPGSSEAQQNLGLAWQELGLGYARQNKMPEAGRAFRELIGLQPTNADACCWLGNALAAQNKLADAIPFYMTALKLNPADFRTEYNLAQTLSLQGKRDEAAEHYRQALRINPNFAEAQKELNALGSPATPP